EELAACSVESVVVPGNVAQVDPGANNVAEPHATLVEQMLCRAEHLPGLFEGIATGAIDVRRVERCLGTKPDQPGAGSHASLTFARRRGPDVAYRPGVAMAGNHGGRGELKDGVLVDRGLLDERGERRNSALADVREDPRPGIEYQRKRAPDIAQKER